MAVAEPDHRAFEAKTQLDPQDQGLDMDFESHE